MSGAAVYRNELLHSIDFLVYALSVLAYLLSPAHLIPFVLRCAAQVQLASPRRIHPTRSLRFFLTGWTAVNIANIVLHSVEGSRGTKGDSWAGKGVILDFVGQAYFPSTIRLVLLDLVIATLQFVVLIVAFGEAIRPESPTTAESTDNAPEGEDNRTVEELSALLGEEFEEDETEIVATSSKYSTDSLNRPIVNIRLRAVWNELLHPTGSRGAEGDIMRGMEEGRGTRSLASEMDAASIRLLHHAAAEVEISKPHSSRRNLVTPSTTWTQQESHLISTSHI